MQLIMTDINNRVVFADDGGIEVCPEGIIVRLTVDCQKDDYSLKYRGIKSVKIKDDKMFFEMEENQPDNSHLRLVKY